MLQTANEVMVASNKIRPTTASLSTSSAPGLLPAQPAAVVTVVGVVVGTPESLEASGTAGINLCPLLLAFSGFPDLGAAVVVAVAVVAVMVVVVVMVLVAVVVVVVVVVVVLVAVVVVVVVMVLVAVVVVVAMVLVFAMCSRI